MPYRGARSIDAFDYLYAEGLWDDLPFNAVETTRHYGGLAVPFRLMCYWGWTDSLSPGSPWAGITQTPIAFWITAHVLPKPGGNYRDPWEIVPARKIWPTAATMTIGLEYLGDSIEPEGYKYMDYIDIIWRMRSIYHSPALNSGMPSSFIYAELHHCSQ